MDPKVARENAIKEAKRNLILDAARKVFAQRGFHDTRLEDIASEAGFSKASLYNYYPDKEAIFLSLATRELDRVVEELHRQNDPLRDACQNLEAMIRVIFAIFGEHFAFMLTLATYPAQPPCLRQQAGAHSVLLNKHMEGLGRILALFGEALGRGRERGEFVYDEEDVVIARYISGIIRSVLLRWRMDRHIGDIDREVRRVMTFVTRGIGGMRSEK
jgi:AcrR family transcriptional regulator